MEADISCVLNGSSDVQFESVFLNKVGQPLLTLTFFSEAMFASSGVLQCCAPAFCRSPCPPSDTDARACRCHPRRRHSAILDHMWVAAVACHPCSFPKWKEKPDHRGRFHHLWAGMPLGVQSSTWHSNVHFHALNMAAKSTQPKWDQKTGTSHPWEPDMLCFCTMSSDRRNTPNVSHLIWMESQTYKDWQKCLWKVCEHAERECVESQNRIVSRETARKPPLCNGGHCTRAPVLRCMCGLSGYSGGPSVYIRALTLDQCGTGCLHGPSRIHQCTFLVMLK